MEKLLVICGPTATGKTSLGISMAKKFNGEIISADSRQVYKGMDIGTGKDLPVNSKFQTPNSKPGYYLIQGIKLWGYDIVSPKEDFSVSKYLKFAERTISDVLKRGKLPILVGGTGLYIKGVVDGISTVDVPLNKKLRKNFEKLSAPQLYEHLSQIDSFRAGSMNSSDNKNPRRLIRAIEVATWMIDNSNKEVRQTHKVYDIFFVGLTASINFIANPENRERKLADEWIGNHSKSVGFGMKLEDTTSVSSWSFIDEKINKRVDKRIAEGFEKEVEGLIKSGVDWNDQAMMSLGYRQWRDYMEGAVDIETAVNEWKKEERKYARRQMVWWKRDGRINWYDVNDPKYVKKVEKMVKTWYI